LRNILFVEFPEYVFRKDFPFRGADKEEFNTDFITGRIVVIQEISIPGGSSLYPQGFSEAREKNL
jgi:hypothetical protein